MFLQPFEGLQSVSRALHFPMRLQQNPVWHRVFPPQFTGSVSSIRPVGGGGAMLMHGPYCVRQPLRGSQWLPLVPHQPHLLQQRPAGHAAPPYSGPHLLFLLTGFGLGGLGLVGFGLGGVGLGATGLGRTGLVGLGLGQGGKLPMLGLHVGAGPHNRFPLSFKLERLIIFFQESGTDPVRMLLPSHSCCIWASCPQD